MRPQDIDGGTAPLCGQCLVASEMMGKPPKLVKLPNRRITDSGAYEYLMSKLEQWSTVSPTRVGNVIKIDDGRHKLPDGKLKMRCSPWEPFETRNPKAFLKVHLL